MLWKIKPSSVKWESGLDQDLNGRQIMTLAERFPNSLRLFSIACITYQVTTIFIWVIYDYSGVDFNFSQQWELAIFCLSSISWSAHNDLRILFISNSKNTITDFICIIYFFGFSRLFTSSCTEINKDSRLSESKS